MKHFGLACEGVTDQITIENILCGHFKDVVDDLDEEITYLQPAFDATDKKTQGFGNWNHLMAYLSHSRFREDVINTKFIVIQVDSDISTQVGFDVAHNDDNGLELQVTQLIEKIINRLIDKINEGDPDFYESNSEKIVFCISVHSIEAWLFNFYNKGTNHLGKTKNCEAALRTALERFHKKDFPRYEKTYDIYDDLSRVFLKPKNISAVKRIDSSFNHFITFLDKINYPNDDE